MPFFRFYHFAIIGQVYLTPSLLLHVQTVQRRAVALLRPRTPKKASMVRRNRACLPKRSWGQAIVGAKQIDERYIKTTFSCYSISLFLTTLTTTILHVLPFQNKNENEAELLNINNLRRFKHFCFSLALDVQYGSSITCSNPSEFEKNLKCCEI